MARRPRLLIADGSYHLYTRALQGRQLFQSDAERRLFIASLGRIVTEHAWRCLAYCLMGTHLHLLLRTPSPDLDIGMRELLGGYAGRVVRARGERGPLFERRYGAKLLTEDSHLAEALRYVALNPVRAGLCGHPSQWPWSSHSALTGERPAPAFLAAAEVYRLVEGLGGGRGPHGYASLVSEAVGGPSPGDSRPARIEPAVPLSALLDVGDGAEIALAHRTHGYPMRSIAHEIGCAVSTVSRRLARFEAKRAATERV